MKNEIKEKYIVFVSGLSGTGKSSLKEYFDGHPIERYRVYDFDKGKYKYPKEEKDHLTWRRKQTEYWLDVSASNLQKNLGSMIFGLSLYPENIIKTAQQKSIDCTRLKFVYLTTEDKTRKERLFKRGTPQHWQGEKEWYTEFYKKQNNVGAIQLDTTHLNIDDSASKLISILVG